MDGGETIGTAARGEIPTGRVTFLFSDVEGSTRLWAEHGDQMGESLRCHDELLRGAIEDHGGYIFTTAGDSFAAAFPHATDAVAAATTAQDALAGATWPGPALAVRMGLHEGRCEERAGDYFGSTVNLAARVEAAGHGGQLLVTEPVAAHHVGATVDLGTHLLAGFDDPVRILQIGDRTFPALRTANTTPSTLPPTRNELIGRSEELARIRRLLGESRIVTLTGVGGAGKTRLAIEAARQRTPSFPGGVFFVDLLAIDSESSVGAALVTGTGLPGVGSADPVGALAARLDGAPALVVIDNCEHVIDAAADLIDDLATRVPEVSVLTTSREALEVDGERTYRVPSLGGGVDGPATQLFVARAEAAHDRFEVRPGDEAVIGAICEQLDGMPLAIELAASRVRVLPLDELRQRLDDRFALLSGGRRRSRQRQQTLEAAISWSYDLLEPDEQAMLRRLSVFRDGFDIIDVAGVAGFAEHDAVDLVEALTAKSLVEQTERRGAPGHRLLESIRMFAIERLVEVGEVGTTRHRHLAHFSSAPARTMRWEGEDLATDVEIERSAREAHNLNAAWEWAIETDDPKSLVSLSQRSNSWHGTASLTASVARLFVDADASDAFDDEHQRQHLLLIVGMGLNQFPHVRDQLEPHVEAAVLRAYGDVWDELLAGTCRWTPATAMLLDQYCATTFPGTAASVVAAYEATGFAAETPHQRWSASLACVLALHYAAGPATAARRLDELIEIRPSEQTMAPMIRTIPPAYTYCLAGRPAEARSLMEQPQNWPPEDVIGGAMAPIAWALLHVAEGRPEDGARSLATSLSRRTIPLAPGQQSAYLGLYARIAHEAGDQARAEELIDLVRPRSPWDFVVCCHTKAIIAGWPDDEFAARADAWRTQLEAAMAQRGEAQINDMVEALDREIGRWATGSAVGLDDDRGSGGDG